MTINENMPKYMYDHLTFSGNVLIKSLGNVFPTRRLGVSFHSIMNGGHFDPKKTTEKVLQYGFYWTDLFKDA